MSVEVAHPRSSTRSSPAISPIDLRHMTSATVLALGPPDSNRRASQHLQIRKGSRSPSSIPSSPTSVHSSSSAIFERDIEPIHVSPSAPGTKKDPHRTARSKNTESIDQSVPSVLDSAASILASMTAEDGDSIAVIAPAPLSSAGLLDQTTVRSRSSGFASPSAASARAARARAPGVATATPSCSIYPRPARSRSSSNTNTAYNTGTARQAQANKRLSFVSYTDLLSSTPTATQPLSALTSPASSPAHIPGVSFGADPSVQGSAYGGSGAPSLRNFG
ncbi:hypothetical protein B0H13DRAFT_1952717, partial [Mycena leptocephala]